MTADVEQEEREVVVVQPLVAERVNAKALVLVTAMLPRPGETPGDWWANTGYTDSGLEDQFWHDVPADLAGPAKKARGKSQPQAEAEVAAEAQVKLESEAA